LNGGEIGKCKSWSNEDRAAVIVRFLRVEDVQVYSSFMRDDGWRQLDTLRLILALVVAVSHAVGIFARPSDVVSESLCDALALAAEVAVGIFFLTSGLVIGRSLISKSHYGDRLFLVYMERRISRIYPPLVFSVVLTASMALLLTSFNLDRYVGAAHDVTRDSFSYLENIGDVEKALLTFGFRGGLTGSSNGPLWSLALEMQAYVVVGLLAQALYSKKVWIKAVSLIGVVIAIRARGTAMPNELSLICFGLFAAGVFLNVLKPRFPKILPVVSVDFSYSLYILHFPIMLFIFFLTCQGEVPSSVKSCLLMFASLMIALAVSIFSGLFIERYRFPQPRFATAK
jgi:peptidoglycan/LPS O-acetylase OafA/YrhL